MVLKGYPRRISAYVKRVGEAGAEDHADAKADADCVR